jgi:hypothetical protein
VQACGPVYVLDDEQTGEQLIGESLPLVEVPDNGLGAQGLASDPPGLVYVLDDEQTGEQLIEDEVLDGSRTSSALLAGSADDRSSEQESMGSAPLGYSALATEPSENEVSDWPSGERRSAGRRGRETLPAALREVVDSGALNDNSDAPVQADKSGRQERAGVRREGQRPRATKVKSGALHRYSAAFVIVLVFVIAGVAAAAIAEVRGPVGKQTERSVAEDRAAAGDIALRTADFPSGWQVSTAGTIASRYGLGSVLVSSSVQGLWLADHRECEHALDAVDTAMISSESTTATAATQATASNSLHGSWQIADQVAFHSTSATAGAGIAETHSLMAQAGTRGCISAFWTAALQSGLPAGSVVNMTVSDLSLPKPIAGHVAWAMSMTGVETLTGAVVPIAYNIVAFDLGHVRVTFETSSKLATLPGSLDAKLLKALTARADKQSSR